LLHSGDLSATLEEFARRPLAFRCKPPPPFKYTGTNRTVRRLLGKQPPPPAVEFVASVQHKLSPPASGDELRLLRFLLGAKAVGFRSLYAKHNGFILYKDTLSKPPLPKAIGLRVLPIRRWKSATSAMKKIVRRFESSSRFDAYFGVAFGWVPGTANFFVTPAEGPGAGQVFLTHDDGAFVSRFAMSFEGFIRRVTTRPVKLLAKDLGCYARYQDGVTFEQWIPIAVARTRRAAEVKM